MLCVVCRAGKALDRYRACGETVHERVINRKTIPVKILALNFNSSVKRDRKAAVYCN